VKHSICYQNVCPSVRLSILSVSHTPAPSLNGTRYRNTFRPNDRAMFHVTWSYISQFWIHEFTPNECVKERLSLSTAKNWTNKTTHLSWKRCEIGGKLQLFTHSKFKVALLMYMAHNRLSPLYISEMLAPVSSTLMHRQLRSSDSSNYTVPRTRTKPGDRAFSVAGPVIWNSIPESIRSVDNVHTFKRLLKTHFFNQLSWSYVSSFSCYFNCFMLLCTA